jgi:hypothetical protein
LPARHQVAERRSRIGLLRGEHRLLLLAELLLLRLRAGFSDAGRLV